MKPWYLSKTILVNIMMGIAMVLASFSPSASLFIQTHFAEAGGAWAIINVGLRLITGKEIG